MNTGANRSPIASLHEVGRLELRRSARRLRSMLKTRQHVSSRRAAPTRREPLAAEATAARPGGHHRSPRARCRPARAGAAWRRPHPDRLYSRQQVGSDRRGHGRPITSTNPGVWRNPASGRTRSSDESSMGWDRSRYNAGWVTPPRSTRRSPNSEQAPASAYSLKAPSPAARRCGRAAALAACSKQFPRAPLSAPRSGAQSTSFARRSAPASKSSSTDPTRPARTARRGDSRRFRGAADG